jgi:hypothetical protein
MQIESKTSAYVAFAGPKRLATGSLVEVAAAARRAQDGAPEATILVFNRHTAEVIDLDLRGSEQEVIARYASEESSASKRGRPKLGVVAREVTLLPRHWEWLARQPGGASTTLRRLVEAAHKSDASASRARCETAYRFMSVMAGDLPGFEEAARALFAGDLERLRTLASGWPADVRDEAVRYADDQQLSPVML